MPDQAPPAPAGCVYGPWWDDCDGDNGAWFIYHFYRGLSAWDSKSGLWEAPGSRGHYDDIYGRELLRLAKENAELRASQPSEEDRAVLWLMKEKEMAVDWTDRFGWKMQTDPGSAWWLCINPTEEARKLGWKP